MLGQQGLRSLHQRQQFGGLAGNGLLQRLAEQRFVATVAGEQARREQREGGLPGAGRADDGN